MPIRRALHVTTALPFQSAPSAWIFLQTHQVSAKATWMSAYITSKLPSLPARRANISFSCSSRTCAQIAQLRRLFVTTSYEGSNEASFVLKISNFTRCRLFSHTTFCFLRTSAIIFRKRHNSLHANQQVHGSWLVICSYPKADCNCSSVCCVFAENELTKTIVVTSILCCAKTWFGPKYPD